MTWRCSVNDEVLMCQGRSAREPGQADGTAGDGPEAE